MGHFPLAAPLPPMSIPAPPPPFPDRGQDWPMPKARLLEGWLGFCLWLLATPPLVTLAGRGLRPKGSTCSHAWRNALRSHQPFGLQGVLTLTLEVI